jgi:dihydroorotase
MSRSLLIKRPDDWHLHLRDGDVLGRTVGDAQRTFARALVMPNLKPPVTRLEDAAAYRERILAAVPEKQSFEPLMTLYLTDKTTPEDVRAAAESGFVVAAKLYPAGATTNSDAGVTDLGRLDDTLHAMAEAGLVLCVHGEVTADAVDIFDREKAFLDEVLGPLVARIDGLKVVLEHITTADGVDFVREGPERVGGTLTAHHLLLNRNDLLAGGLKPHHYCLPVLKSERHRQALVEAATSGHPRFFLGTDSAPHARGAKECASGCAGCYTAAFALELYAEAFDDAGALDKLEAFASFFGPDFYGRPRNEDQVHLLEEPTSVPTSLDFGGEEVVPLRAGGQLRWRVVG